MKNSISNILLIVIVLILSVNGASAVTKIALLGSQDKTGLDESIVATYPELLENRLGDKYVLESFCIKNAQILGEKSLLKSDRFKSALAYNPDILVIDVGFNDASPNYWSNAKLFYKSYAKIIAKFKAKNSNIRIILCKPIPVFNKELAKHAKNIKDKVIPIIETIAKVENLKVVDLYSAMLWNPHAYEGTSRLNEQGLAIVTRAVSHSIKSCEATALGRYQTAFKF